MSLPEVIWGTSGLGNLYTALSDEIKQAIVSAYINECKGAALPFFDSAGKYGAGLALESLGKSLRALNVPPDGVCISNKLGWLRVPLQGTEPIFEPGVWKDIQFDAVQKISYSGILECYEQGNELLGDYQARYVSVHDPDEYLAAAKNKEEEASRFEDILAAYDALKELKAAGKVEAIGVGAKDWRSIARIYEKVELDWIMIANSMTVHLHPAELLEFMKMVEGKGTVIINSAVFNGGFLTGGEFYNYKWVDPATREGEELYQWRKQFYELCDEFEVSPVAVGIQFGLAAPGVRSIALSTSSPAKVSPNLKLPHVSIPEGLWQELHNRKMISDEAAQILVNHFAARPSKH